MTTQLEHSATVASQAPEPFATPREIAEEFGFTVNALAQWRFVGSGPTFYRPTPRTIRYLRSEVRTWILESARTTTAEVAQ